MSTDLPARPEARKCNTALNILTAFERLANDRRKHIPPRVLITLRAKRDDGTITIDDLPGWLRAEWPGGEFNGMTLAEIRRMCGRR